MVQNAKYNGMLYKHSNLTEEIIGAYFVVYNALGYGFLEKVYANALRLELELRSLKVRHEVQLLNYLKATYYEVGLLLNFGPKPEQKRRSFDNNRKEWWLAENRS